MWMLQINGEELSSWDLVHSGEGDDNLWLQEHHNYVMDRSVSLADSTLQGNSRSSFDTTISCRVDRSLKDDNVESAG
jgi:hypothetical protein